MVEYHRMIVGAAEEAKATEAEPPSEAEITDPALQTYLYEQESVPIPGEQVEILQAEEAKVPAPEVASILTPEVTAEEGAALEPIMISPLPPPPPLVPEGSVITPSGTLWIPEVGDTGITPEGVVVSAEAAAQEGRLEAIESLGIAVDPWERAGIQATREAETQAVHVGGSYAFVDEPLPGTEEQYRVAVEQWERTKTEAEQIYQTAEAELVEGETLTETREEFLQRVEAEFKELPIATFKPDIAVLTVRRLLEAEGLIVGGEINVTKAVDTFGAEKAAAYLATLGVEDAQELVDKAVAELAAKVEVSEVPEVLKPYEVTPGLFDLKQFAEDQMKEGATAAEVTELATGLGFGGDDVTAAVERAELRAVYVSELLEKHTESLLVDRTLAPEQFPGLHLDLQVIGLAAAGVALPGDWQPEGLGEWAAEEWNRLSTEQQMVAIEGARSSLGGVEAKPFIPIRGMPVAIGAAVPAAAMTPLFPVAILVLGGLTAYMAAQYAADFLREQGRPMTTTEAFTLLGTSEAEYVERFIPPEVRMKQEEVLSVEEIFVESFPLETQQIEMEVFKFLPPEVQQEFILRPFPATGAATTGTAGGLAVEEAEALETETGELEEAAAAAELGALAEPTMEQQHAAFVEAGILREEATMVGVEAQAMREEVASLSLRFAEELEGELGFNPLLFLGTTRVAVAERDPTIAEAVRIAEEALAAGKKAAVAEAMRLLYESLEIYERGLGVPIPREKPWITVLEPPAEVIPFRPHLVQPRFVPFPFLQVGVDVQIAAAIQATTQAATQAAIQAFTQTYTQALTDGFTQTQAQVHAQTATQAAAQTAVRTAVRAITNTSVRTAVRAATRTIVNTAVNAATTTAASTLGISSRRLLPPLLLPPQKEKEVLLMTKPGTMTWKMGELKQGPVWKVIPPPYDMSKPITMFEPPPGAVNTHLRTPAETIQVIGGPVPYDVSVDLGVVDIFVKGGTEEIVFRGKGMETDVGTRLPSPTTGMSVEERVEEPKTPEEKVAAGLGLWGHETPSEIHRAILRREEADEEETETEREMLPKLPGERPPLRPRAKAKAKPKASATQLQELLPLE